MHRRRFVMSTATRIDELSTLPGGAQTEPALQVERPPVDLSAGATLGSKYILQRELGRGGVGAVFAAENTWTGRCVAIKVLQPEYASVTTVVSRFWREARVASKLRHPNIVDVLDMGLDERSGAPFIVEELLDGEGYDVALDRAPGGRVTPSEALAVLLPVMDALALCHEAGVVHRDVKPSNIFLARDAQGAVTPKLIDFGVSRTLQGGRDSSAAGLLFGTPHYMSPEQARGEADLDARADVWAMGVTLFEAITGRCPFEEGEPLVVLVQVQHSTPPRIREVWPGVPEDLAAVIDRALAPARDDRYPSMRAFIDALLACEAARGFIARPSVASMPAESPSRWYARDLRAAGLVLIPALVVAVLTIALAPRAWNPPPVSHHVVLHATPPPRVLTPPTTHAAPVARMNEATIEARVGAGTKLSPHRRADATTRRAAPRRRPLSNARPAVTPTPRPRYERFE